MEPRKQSALQDTFSQLFEKWDSLEQPENAMPWLVTVLRNAWHNLKRTQSRHDKHRYASARPLADEDPSIHEDVELWRAQHERIRTLADEMPPALQRFCHSLLQFDFDRTAVQMHLSINDSLYRRKLQLLREWLKNRLNGRLLIVEEILLLTNIVLACDAPKSAGRLGVSAEAKERSLRVALTKAMSARAELNGLADDSQSKLFNAIRAFWCFLKQGDLPVAIHALQIAAELLQDSQTEGACFHDGMLSHYLRAALEGTDTIARQLSRDEALKRLNDSIDSRKTPSQHAVEAAYEDDGLVTRMRSLGWSISQRLD